jgi:hypothetical protein
VPTVIKSSSNVAKLGDLSTYSISTAAIPYDTSDSSGAVPTVSVTMADGTDTDYLMGETLTISNPAVSKYSGEIVDISSSSNSGRYTLNMETLISRLNSEQRLYPSPSSIAPTVDIPIAALDYWTQQCGVFYDNIEGDPLFYQSQYYHWFAFAKGTTRPIRGRNYTSAGAGEEVGYTIYGGRYVTTFGKNRNLTVAFPPKEPLPALIPAPSNPKLMVFSSSVRNQGTGRQGTITWNFNMPDKKPIALRAVIDSSAGISMQINSGGTVFATLGTVAAAVNGDFRLNIGVTSYSATYTSFTLNVINSAGVVTSLATTNVATKLAGNLSLVSIIYRGEDQGSGTVGFHWADSISVMDAMPTKLPVVQKALVAGVKKAQTFVGYSGNVWENIKAYCSIFHLDISCVAGKLTIGPRQTETSPVPTLGTLTKRINKRDQARFVEVVCRNSVPTVSGGSVTPRVMWKADTVYQVAVGATEEFLVQTEHSILDLQQPVAVSGISPFPYTAGTGQYVVTGSDGYIVAPAFWRDQGGLITVDTTDNEGEIKITIKGPDFDSPRAPYRISEGDAGRPALYITGQGVINTPKTLRVSTGNTKAAKEVGVTLDSPFIGDATLAYDAAARAARKFATPDVQIGVTEALDYDSPSALGSVPAGQLIKRDGNILRLTDATQTPSTISGSTAQHNTIAQVKKSFGTGTTIAQAKTFYAGKTIGQTNLKPLKVVK